MLRTRTRTFSEETPKHQNVNKTPAGFINLNWNKKQALQSNCNPSPANTQQRGRRRIQTQTESTITITARQMINSYTEKYATAIKITLCIFLIWFLIAFFLYSEYKKYVNRIIMESELDYYEVPDWEWDSEKATHWYRICIFGILIFAMVRMCALWRFWFFAAD